MSWILDPRFRVVVVAGHPVIELASTAATAGASKSSKAPAAPKEGAPPQGAKKEKKKEEKVAGGDVVLGVDGKPLSKKELRILERQRKEVCSPLRSFPFPRVHMVALVRSRFLVVPSHCAPSACPSGSAHHIYVPR
jgi:hypothetical protein